MPEKILAIDDDPEMLNLLEYTLGDAGFEVHLCDSGRQAWERIQQVKPDLVLLDVMLPGIDGYSLELKISEDDLTKDLPVIIMTSLEPSKTLFSKFSQVTAFVTKPFKPDDLVQKVRSALQSAKKQ